jgi:hypothetical protein
MFGSLNGFSVGIFSNWYERRYENATKRCFIGANSVFCGLSWRTAFSASKAKEN